jgi:UDP-GlcNAc:undecaprenyl-phosphate GlcNAc-1-phosphate transferase
VREFLEKMGVDTTEMDLEEVISSKQEKMQRPFVWSRNGFNRCDDICKECLLKLELPLINGVNKNWGFLWLVKDVRRQGINHYTLRRVENLRRTVLETLKKLEGVGDYRVPN